LLVYLINRTAGKPQTHLFFGLMRTLQFVKIFLLSFSLVLACGLPIAIAESFSTAREPVTYSHQDILAQLLKANIIYLGETHDSPEDHRAQQEIIQALHRHKGKIAIAMEMFQRPFQTLLDRYLAGEITEAELREQTEYDQRWGFDWEFYAPILRFAKVNQLPVLALNTSTEISRKVAREGLESLTEAERRYIPPFSEIRTDNEAYRQLLQESFSQHDRGGHGNSHNFDRFFLVQVLWDETMAEKIAQFWSANPDYQIVVLAGKGHIQYNYGIPSRVERRLQERNLVQRSVWLGSFPEGEEPPADFTW
jgi:uncharacterized iron-regulated protein